MKDRTDERLKADDAPLLLLHGFLGSKQDWEPHLQNVWHRTLAVDLPGHGANHAADCTFAAAAAQIWADLDQGGIEALHLLGYSMGARLALYMAVSRPQRVMSLILESGSPGLSDPRERELRRAADELWARRLEAAPLAEFLQQWYDQPLFAGLKNSAGFDALLARRLQNRPEGLARSLRQAGTGTAPSQWQSFPGLNLPMLFLAGSEDAKFRAIGEHMASLNPNLRLKILPGGHCLNQESPEPWLTAVRTFLAQSAGT